MRAFAILVHRYVGLALTAFLVVAGLTGSVLAFQHELDALVAPELHRVAPPSPSAEPLPAPILRERLLAVLPPGSVVNTLFLRHEAGRSRRFWVDPPEASNEPADTEYFVDPYSGELVGSRRGGALSQGTKNLIPFLYELHYSLALGEVGSLLFGVVALLWTLDCFVGAYLTFPVRRRTSSVAVNKPWLRRWARAWTLQTGKLFSLVFSWHRASGLWVWALLLVFAWSAVGLNLNGQVYRPVMGAVFPTETTGWTIIGGIPDAGATGPPQLSFERALAHGEALMAEQAATGSFQVIAGERLRYFPDKRHYQYRAHTSLDIQQKFSATAVWFHADTGVLSAFDAPTGQAVGNTAHTWLMALHFADVRALGAAYQAFVSLMGFAIALLCVSGVCIWWRKRGKR